MKLTLDRKKLQSSLNKLSSLVEKRNILPILDMVKISLADNKINLITTDLDITGEDSFELESNCNDLDFTLPVHTLFEITKKLSNYEKIELDLTKVAEGKVEIIAGPSKLTMPSLGIEEFPSFEKMDTEEIPVKIGDLKRILSKTKHAISAGEMRYYLNGVHLSTEGDKLIAAATDVHRLAIASCDKPENLDIPQGIILPKKAMNEILSLLNDLDDNDFVPLQVNDNRLSIRFDKTSITTKLLHGKFPNYKAVFDLQQEKEFNLNVKELVKAIELVSAIADSKIKIVHLTLVNNLLTVTLDNSREGKGSKALQELIVESNLEQEGLSLLLNAKYLLDALGVTIGPQVYFKISNSTSPVIIKDQEDPLVTFVLMPMQLDSN